MVINYSLLHSCPQLSRIAWNHCLHHCVMCSGVARSQRLGEAEGVQQGPGAEPRWGSGGKQDTNFVLRITFVNTYRPYCSSYNLIGFSRSSHISDFQSLVYLSFTPSPLSVHTSHRICTNLRIESRAGWGAAPPFAPPRGDANEDHPTFTTE